MLNFILLVNKIAKFVLLIPFGYAKGTIIAKSSFSNIEYKGIIRTDYSDKTKNAFC
jgi:hypothetical protein